MARPELPPREREYLHYSLGKIYDDCGRYDDAFEQYRQANAIGNAAVVYDADRLARATDSIIEVFTKEFLSQPCPGASPSRAPVFIVGMPRSGTTLLAAILSNHPAIGSAGELPTIIQIATQLGEGTGIGYPQAARQLSAPVSQQLTTAYLARLRRDIGADVPFVVDKHPINFRHVGLITRLFPEATILHCTRDPLDTCLSNYFQRFAPEYDFAFDLANVGHYYGQYARLMEHWRGALPRPIIEVPYERMVAQTEVVARDTRHVGPALGRSLPNAPHKSLRHRNGQQMASPPADPPAIHRPLETL